MSVPALVIPALAVAFTTLLVLAAVLATRPKQIKSTIRLSAEQRGAIQDHFNNGPTLAGSYGWSRRQYAPMHIHSKAFSSLRDQIHEQLRQGWPLAMAVRQVAMRMGTCPMRSKSLG